MNRVVEACRFPGPEVRAEVEALAGAFEPEWATTLNADQARPAWFLCRQDGRLVGFLTVFAPSNDTAEVGAFVDQDHRRQGVFSALFAGARRAWEGEARRWLLVVNRESGEGLAVARRRGLLSFTEGTLGLSAGQRPQFPGLVPGLTLGPAGPEDQQVVCAVWGRAKGEDPATHRDGARAFLFGLAVDPGFQGRGWGRLMVLGLLEWAGPGFEEFRLEVDSSNARAEKLYRSLGFTDRQTIDYYLVAGS